jgi:hypothetical protein
MFTNGAGASRYLRRFGNHTESQSFDPREGLVAVCTVAQDAGQSWHLGEPTAIVFAVDLNQEHHARDVPPILTVSQSNGTIASELLRCGTKHDRLDIARSRCAGAPMRALSRKRLARVKAAQRRRKGGVPSARLRARDRCNGNRSVEAPSRRLRRQSNRAWQLAPERLMCL